MPVSSPASFQARRAAASPSPRSSQRKKPAAGGDESLFRAYTALVHGANLSVKYRALVEMMRALRNRKEDRQSPDQGNPNTSGEL